MALPSLHGGWQITLSVTLKFLITDVTSPPGQPLIMAFDSRLVQKRFYKIKSWNFQLFLYLYLRKLESNIK